jgi:mRNA interferase MazF
VAINIHPKSGQILLCDFSGFKEPEMVKTRPVVILVSRAGLVTVLPLSTVEPTLIQPYHYKIPKQSMPMIGRFEAKESWVKGDMPYAVGHHRLNLIRLGKRGTNGKRLYFTSRLGSDQMKKIKECLLHGLNLGNLGAYL